MEPLPPPLPEHDPYRVPGAALDHVVASPIGGRERRLVGGGKRFLTYLVDLVTFAVVFLGIVFVAGALSGFIDDGATIQQIPDIAYNIAAYGFWLVYYIGWESVTGRTPGKYVLGTIVVNDTGQAPSFGQCVGRSVARFIPFEAFSCFGSESRGWHDSLANTYVVSVH